jgi:hypothetical protein
MWTKLHGPSPPSASSRAAAALSESGTDGAVCVRVCLARAHGEVRARVRLACVRALRRLFFIFLSLQPPKHFEYRQQYLHMLCLERKFNAGLSNSLPLRGVVVRVTQAEIGDALDLQVLQAPLALNCTL